MQKTRKIHKLAVLTEGPGASIGQEHVAITPAMNRFEIAQALIGVVDKLDVLAEQMKVLERNGGELLNRLLGHFELEQSETAMSEDDSSIFRCLAERLIHMQICGEDAEPMSNDEIRKIYHPKNYRDAIFKLSHMINNERYFGPF